MKCVSKNKLIDGVLWKKCNGKSGCGKWKIQAEHFSEKGTLLSDGTPQILSVCNPCRKIREGTYAASKQYRDKETVIETIMATYTPFPWKPNLKPWNSWDLSC
jgi:hypothetical protein